MKNSYTFTDCSLELSANEAELISFALSHTILFLNHCDSDLWNADIVVMKKIRAKLKNIEEG